MIRPGAGSEAEPRPTTTPNFVAAIVANRSVDAERKRQADLGHQKLGESLPLIKSVLEQYNPQDGMPLTSRGSRRPGKGFAAYLPTPDQTEPVRVNVVVEGYSPTRAKFFQKLKVEVPELDKALVVTLGGFTPEEPIPFGRTSEIGEEDDAEYAALSEVNDFMAILGELDAGRVVSRQGTSILDKPQFPSANDILDLASDEDVADMNAAADAVDRTLRRPGVLD